MRQEKERIALEKEVVLKHLEKERIEKENAQKEIERLQKQLKR